MPNGSLIIDKPANWTSMDVCAKIRGILREKRVGHGGTLDPMATGVLPVFVGQATRAVEFAENSRKEYVAGLRLGQVTNSQDISGETLEARPVTASRAEVEAAMARSLGPIQQIPPMYSAIKINGQKLYELARRGQEVARRPRSITIHALELLEGEGAVIPIAPEHLGKVAELAETGAINSGAAKKVIAALWTHDEEPEDYVARAGLRQESDENVLRSYVRRAMEEHPDMVESYRRGKVNLGKALMGAAMSLSAGRANPVALQRLMDEALQQK